MRHLLTLLILLITLTGEGASAFSHKAAGSGTESFTWTMGGRALTKTNARGTTIGYFYGSGTSGTVAGAGDLTDVTYTDSTPAIAYTFDRLGRMVTATSGGVTRTLSQTLHGQQESEAWTGGPLDGLTVDPGFDSLRRLNALAVTGAGGTVPSQGYSYNTLTGELETISSTGPGLSGTASATYSYRTGTRQIAGVTFAESSITRLTQARTYDDLHRLTGVTSQTAGSVDVSTSSYTLDDAGRRSSTLLADGTWWKYTYDGHGQVTAAERRRMTGSTPNVSDPAVPGQQFTYAYDGLGNRTAATQGGGGVTDDTELTYTPTTANQYSAIAHNRTGIATGTADPSATVTVNSNSAARSGPWWAQSESASTGTSAAWLNFSIDATLGGSTDHTDTQLLVPPSSVSPSYDADGNLLNDGLRTFTWDAENRLNSVTTIDTLLPAGAPMVQVLYQYDDGGRRIAETVLARTVPGGTYALVSRRCFLFDGWQCVAEYDYTPSGGGATRTLFRSQLWGPDFGGGGAGGLLLISRHTGPLTGTHFATHDGNGNVTALVDASTGTESTRYDYDPFGNLLRATGAFAAENPYRFSTQFTDEVTGLLYYGYRHYDSVHGRWLSRDPIGEHGGMNLYGFVSNNGICEGDALGLSFWGWIRGEEGWIPGHDTAGAVQRGWEGAKQGAQNVAEAYVDAGDVLIQTGDWWGQRIGNALYDDAAWERDRANIAGGARMVGNFWYRYAVDDNFSDQVNHTVHDLITEKVEGILSDPDKASKFFAAVSANAAFSYVGARGTGFLLDAATNIIAATRAGLAELRLLEAIARSVPDRCPPRSPKTTINHRNSNHQRVVNRIAAQLREDGYVVKGNGARFYDSTGKAYTNSDLLAVRPDGTPIVLEIKTGAAFTSKNQNMIYPQILKGEAIPSAPVAKLLGIEPKIPLKLQGYPEGIQVFLISAPGL